jgi:hypothetical protein
VEISGMLAQTQQVLLPAVNARHPPIRSRFTHASARREFVPESGQTVISVNQSNRIKSRIEKETEMELSECDSAPHPSIKRI